MPLKGFECKCGKGDFNVAIECVKSGRAKALGCHHSAIMLESMSAAEKRPEMISVTELMQGDWNCHREVWLKKKFDYYEKPESLYRAWHGTQLHKMLACDQTNTIKEMRITKEIRVCEKSYWFCGKFDYYDAANKILADVKTVKEIVEKWLPNEHHVVQLNLYACLAASVGFNVRKLELHYFDNKRSHITEARLWKEEECLDYLYKNLIPLSIAIERQEIPTYKKIRKCDYCSVREKCHEFLEAER